MPIEEPNSVKNFFNNTENYLSHNFGIRLRTEIIENIIGNIHNKEILDVGCGDGSLSLQFCKNNKITLADISENMLKKAKQKIPEAAKNNVNIINDDIANLKTDTQYDYVLGIGLLAHVPSIEATLEQLSSLTTNNGTLIIQFSNYSNLLTKLNFISKGNRKHQLNHIYKKKIIELLNDNNLVIKKEIQYSLLFPGIGIFGNKLIYKYHKLVYKSSLLSKLGTDYILVLTKTQI